MFCAFFQGRQVALITMHSKEEVIVPALQPLFASEMQVVRDFNTDVFGTFTREIPRQGTQLETARTKAEKAMELTALDIGIGSEGSFGSHPSVPFVPWNLELVVLVDKKEQLVIVGEYATATTNYAQKSVVDEKQAVEFARQVGFPAHWLIVRPEHASHPELLKGINTWQKLSDAVAISLSRSPNGTVFLETDMRAHANPTRMQNIAKAAFDLAEKLVSCCSRCQTPGFAPVRKVRGLPCEWCGLPTEEIKGIIFGCQKCAHEEVRAVSQTKAPAGRCQHCNP